MTDGDEWDKEADLTDLQREWMQQIDELFPRGVILCMPANRDTSQVPEEQDNHIFFTNQNIERMWGALYDFFETGKVRRYVPCWEALRETGSEAGGDSIGR